MCTRPLVLYQYKENGKTISKYAFDYVPERHNRKFLRKLAQNNHKVGFVGKYIVVPCGKCPLCLRRRIMDWKTRLCHHLNTNPKCIFLTLTYNDDYMDSPHLDYSHFQKFMKRLRYHFPEASISYFVAGEYGVKSLRRHFHAIIFGIDKNDLNGKFFCVSRKDKNIRNYISDKLTSLWEYGYHYFSTVSIMDDRAIGYVCGYMYSKMSDKHINDVQSAGLLPEFHHMSLKTKIGYDYYVKYYKQMFNNCFCYASRRKVPIPRAYMRWYIKDTSYVSFSPLTSDPDYVKWLESKLYSDNFDDCSLLDFYLEKIYDGSQFSIDIKSKFDIIKLRWQSILDKAASTCKMTLYHLRSKEINFVRCFSFTRD